MRVKKPAGWPSYMTAKRLKASTAYYWSPPTWAKKQGCTIDAEPLGSDYTLAKARCDEVLNPQFESWRKRELPLETTRALPGTYDWLVAVYKSLPAYAKKPDKTRRSYDAALAIIADFKLKDGRRFGALGLKSITPGAVDRLYHKILDGGRGDRQRTAKLCIDVARNAWNKARRDKPTIVPSENPFKGVEIEYEPKETSAATLAQVMTFVAKADELGRASLGTAAMIGFFWLQRVEDIFTRLAWTHYRPADMPGFVRVFHHKTGAVVDMPLYDDDGSELWPELIARLDAAERVGTLIVMRDSVDRKRKVQLPWATSASNPLRHAQREIARIRDAAELPENITFTTFRHGGHTEGADADLTDAQLRALGAHRTTRMIRLYAKGTPDQRRAGARKRLARRTKQGALSE